MKCIPYFKPALSISLEDEGHMYRGGSSTKQNCRAGEPLLQGYKLNEQSSAPTIQKNSTAAV